MTSMDATGPILRRFSLVARPRPSCTPIEARVSELCRLAHSAEQDHNHAAASAVINQAALVVSDVGLPDLARAWCHRHAAAYLRRCPLGLRARYALEPLVNLARLHIRDGNGQAALTLLTDLYQAVVSRTDAAIDGLPLPAATLTTTPEEHHELRQWLWTVHIAEGARALTSAGRWHDALTHLHEHAGVGRRMLDGRQTAVIAHSIAGDIHGALALLKDTAPGDPWEAAVTACLTMLCRNNAGQAAGQDRTTMLERYRQLAPAPGLTVFHTRLGLSVIDLLGPSDRPAASDIAAMLFQHALAGSDGYAARDLLTHDGCIALLQEEHIQQLTSVVETCALGLQRLPIKLMEDLSAAVDDSETVIISLADALPATRVAGSAIR